VKAAVVTRYGPPEVVELREVPAPQPRAGELAIRVHASTVTAADWRLRSGDVPRGFGLLVRLALGWRGPRQSVLGGVMAGEVLALGTGVTRFAVGDRVFAMTGMRMGGHAEVAVLKESGSVGLIAPGISFETAAALLFGGTTAFHFLKDKGGIKPGDRVLINGASGEVGTAAIQLARFFGAEVTAVTSAVNAHLAARLGANRVIDYQAVDFTTEGVCYDLILDAVGNCPYARARHVLADGGRLLLVATDLMHTLGATIRPRRRAGHRIIAGVAAEKREVLERLMALAARGTLTPPIDRRYPLDEIRAAHVYVETRRKRGSVIVSIDLAVQAGPACTMARHVRPVR
jgi:NADPH:quinone reductase-like Zn-dependent oxidoreductase